MKNIKTGKILATVIIVIVFLCGLVLLFLPDPISKLQAYKIFVEIISPVVFPLLGGVAIDGIVKTIMEKINK